MLKGYLSHTDKTLQLIPATALTVAVIDEEEKTELVEMEICEYLDSIGVKRCRPDQKKE